LDVAVQCQFPGVENIAVANIKSSQEVLLVFLFLLSWLLLDGLLNMFFLDGFPDDADGRATLPSMLQSLPQIKRASWKDKTIESVILALGSNRARDTGTESRDR
jgi:hypothetical protein